MVSLRFMVENTTRRPKIRPGSETGFELVSRALKWSTQDPAPLGLVRSNDL
jgi:hypothetical protein